MASIWDPYSNGLDFTALALRSPAFAKFLKSNGQLDFSDPKAVKELSTSLLKQDFGLDVELPDDRLCPPIPNRLNYIFWLQDLLDTTSDSYDERYDSERDVVGLDVGTGASCIYPLLACTQRPKWILAGTDIDESNVHSAMRNVVANKLKARIKVLKVDRSDRLIPIERIGVESLDFVMCNPPFYDSVDDMVSSAKRKQRPAFSACTGAEVEMVTPGGEVAFVERILDESVLLKDRVQWYTSMLGKLSSVSTIVEKLKERGVANWAMAEFVQGNKTRRWAVGWSWSDMRPTMAVARNINSLPKHLMPFPSEYSFQVVRVPIDVIGQRLNTVLTEAPLQWQWRAPLATGVGFAMENVWSRASRRQRGSSDDTTHDADEIDEEEAALGFKVQLRGLKDSQNTGVVIRWLKGNDSVLFESFCGMLKRKIETPG